MDAVAGEGWRALAEALAAGIAHDLNGRLTALSGVAHMARATGGMDEELVRILEDEAVRLEAAIEMLRAMPFGGTGEPELIRLSELVPELAQLYTGRSGPEPPRVVVDGDPSAIVHAPRARLAELLLLVLAAAEARTTTRAGDLRVWYGVEPPDAVLRIAGAASPRPGEAEGGRRPVDRAAAAAEASALAGRLGGRLDRSGAGMSSLYVIRLPAVTP
jgi:C4-dicarboxylate-specific signal transduction histidine kinase